MKTRHIARHWSSSRGFTLIELMTVVAIIAVLASLTIIGFKTAQITAARNRTAAFHSAIKSGLDHYSNDFGGYPTPAGSGEMVELQEKEYPVDGAVTLYQALSGDGDDAIKLGSSKLGPSDGQVVGPEVEYVKLTEMPREMVMEHDNKWFLIDGFNHPFQYTKAPPPDRPGSAPSAKVTIINDYDLWSYAESAENTDVTDLASKENPKISAKWIKNW